MDSSSVVLFVLSVAVLYVAVNSAKSSAVSHEKEDWAVEVYKSDNCGHCVKAMPEILKLRELLKKQGIKVYIYNADTKQDSYMFTMRNVQGYPTILLTKEETVLSYDGDRTADAMLSFVEQHAR